MSVQIASKSDKSEGDDHFGGPSSNTTFLGYLREWLDAGVIAIVLAMFIRTFVVELFKIPSGSMTPTLLGDPVAEGQAFDKDGKRYDFLFVMDRNPNVRTVHIFRENAQEHMEYVGKKNMDYDLTRSQQDLINEKRTVEEHRILVNKFAYWFKTPERGDIIVFRVPFELNPEKGYERNGMEFRKYPYNRSQSVYVKRCVGLPGERVEIRDDEHLYANGEQITKPDVIKQIRYFKADTATYDVTVPEGHVLAMGDNSANSADSRYWGPLPTDNLRGKAIARYYPWRKIRFLNK